MLSRLILIIIFCNAVIAASNELSIPPIIDATIRSIIPPRNTSSLQLYETIVVPSFPKVFYLIQGMQSIIGAEINEKMVKKLIAVIELLEKRSIKTFQHFDYKVAVFFNACTATLLLHLIVEVLFLNKIIKREPLHLLLEPFTNSPFTGQIIQDLTVLLSLMKNAAKLKNCGGVSPILLKTSQRTFEYICSCIGLADDLNLVDRAKLGQLLLISQRLFLKEFVKVKLTFMEEDCYGMFTLAISEFSRVGIDAKTVFSYQKISFVKDIKQKRRIVLSNSRPMCSSGLSQIQIHIIVLNLCSRNESIHYLWSKSTRRIPFKLFVSLMPPI